MQISASITIYRPPEIVFPWLENPDQAMEWQTSVAGGEIIEKIPGWIGTRFRETVEENGRSTSLEGEVTDFVKNKRMAFHLEGDYNSVDVVFTLEDRNGATEFTQTANVRFKGVSGLISVIFGSLFRKKILEQARRELAELKRLCEQK